MPRISLTLSLALLTVTSLAITTPIVYAEPAAIVAQGGDRGGPAIFVPTDVTGTQIELVDPASVPASALKVRFERFPDKFTCKKYLIQEDNDTKCSKVSDGAITFERGKILITPTDGRLLVHTKLADVAVPKDGIALISYERDRLSIFNLAGREFVIQFSEKEGAPHHKSNYDECIGMDEGFGIVSHDTKGSVDSGILQYVGPLATSAAVVAVVMRNFTLAVIDPMRILQNDSIMKSLTAEKWLSALSKVEDTTVRVGVWQKEESHR